MAIVYGVDTETPYTAEDILKAIEACFKKAHDEVLEKELGDFKSGMTTEEFDEIKKINVHQMVRKYLDEVGGSYQKPTKDKLIALCDKLADFAKNFRSPEIIGKHYNEIMQLITKLP